MSDTDTIRLLNEALGGNPRAVENALAAIGASGGGGGGTTLLATGEAGTGSEINSSAIEQIGNTISFTVPEGGGTVRVEAIIYCAGTNGGDIALAITDDAWTTETVLDPYENVAPLPVWVKGCNKVRTISATYFMACPAVAVLELAAGDYEVGVYHYEASPMVTLGGKNNPIVVTMVG